MSDALKFFTKNGHRIPIRQASMAAHGARTAVAAKHIVRGAVVGGGAYLIAKHGRKEPKGSPVKINKSLQIASLGTAVASGVIGALTFTGGAKKVVSGALGVHLVDALGVGLNVASAKGGDKKDKAKVIAKQEAVNFAVGNAVFLSGLVALKKNREGAAKYAAGVVNFARKALRVI
jgi:hypothetical protein